MQIVFSPQAIEDYEYWKNNPVVLKRIKRLLVDIAEHPFTGIGKPEKLRPELSGKWSRRIDSEHRIIYSVNEEYIEVYILAMRYHCSKK
ncbi:Txe/YoeB family addiction module toxin [Paludibacter sp. 221]|uniref:Txe/YoeB family addiction module toxin n=1 Tax=Paludibacter sp. 221 TaxID=2302939 RepID=UPI0013D83840|nr:Txe/YoeB family addiction module toxin [Paludibacter sp. 221]NDV47282.1 Txe/YoeB family addiction module toxin [Paludibacter sp. 221]